MAEGSRAASVVSSRDDGNRLRRTRRQHELRVRFAWSLGLHFLVLLGLTLSPAQPAAVFPSVVTVDLVAAVPPPPAARKAEAKAPAAPAPPKPAPPKAKKVLPKEAQPLRKKPKPPPKKVAAPRRPRAPELDYDDALAELRREAGEETPTEPSQTEPDPTRDEILATTAPGRGGVAVPAEVLQWTRDASRHVRSVWVTPQEFLDRGLQTGLSVDLTSGGDLVGAPRVVRSSGNPYFDDNAVRAVERAAPLPPPPSAGSWTFVFAPEERL